MNTLKYIVSYKILYAPMNLAMKIALKFYDYPKGSPSWKLKLHRLCIRFYDYVFTTEGTKHWRLSCLSNEEGTLSMDEYC